MNSMISSPQQPAMVSDLSSMADKAGEAARLMRTLGHDGRLLVLCALVGQGEASAGELVGLSGLSQSALSQHLTILREQGLVATRRQGTSIIYRLADPRVAAVLETLHRLYCGPHSDTDPKLETDS
ncbi:MAG: metalloregulator ArsR/SmtB family transcription factor [Hyphomonadaceae bacterium]|jgi:ArsR family transcriptional regulator|nr:metalloregulator ArsR/SmtB family transcription factor [Hyphomonadaceae bacterium]